MFTVEIVETFDQSAVCTGIQLALNTATLLNTAASEELIQNWLLLRLLFFAAHCSFEQWSSNNQPALFSGNNKKDVYWLPFHPQEPVALSFSYFLHHFHNLLP
jgi:hypothetical protein